MPLIGRIVAWPSSLISTALILIGLFAQLIKKILGITHDPIAWIAALAPIYYLPPPFTPIPYLIGAALGLIGLPFSSTGGKKDAPVTSSNNIVADEEEDKTSIVAMLLTPVRNLILLLLALLESLIGVSPVTDNNGIFWNKLFVEESAIFPPRPEFAKANKFPKEKWIYINGIATDKKGAKSNATLMHSMFGRPVHVVHNPTDGFVLDILECLAGKTELIKYGDIEPRNLLMKFLTNSLKEAKASGIEKVVLIAHSQGTIITGNSIRLLGEGQDGEVKKLMKELLEVYTFAGCAHCMPGEYVRHLENLSNKGDVVAWLGHVCPNPVKSFWRNTDRKPIKYTYKKKDESLDKEEDKSIIEDKGWGHLLAKHYLKPMMFEGKFADSRLVKEYMKGGKQN
eukprot:CAMPEP_0204630066 /NCGR_PEP_ID=MMETSP0717-20131115/19510_1 /ASSEMBLY_ACC=CAM_ASM_000666 /TAXON_ID=230516 /ORGANISM="Chaetoceros curvisetus" /LENGTH=396 /DNA_ID=CAMNT_0051647193 /DNA_START=106 /DNA_END=1296 /DNA_ORIENTATION=+